MTAADDEALRLEPGLAELALRALTIALRGPLDFEMMEIAERVVLRVAHEYPDHGLWCACLIWCDTVQGKVPGLSAARLDGVGLAFIDADNGRASRADSSVPDEVQWAGRFLFARLRDDRDLALALWSSTTDGVQMGPRVMALLSMAALNIKQGEIRTGTAAELEIGGRRG